MKCLLLVLLILGNAASLPADEKKAPSPLVDARQRLQRGNIAEARAKYEVLLKDDTSRVPAAIGLARSYRAEGEYAKALAAIDHVLNNATQAANPDLLAAKAELFYSTGRWEEALKMAETVLKAKRDHFLARWVRAQILRDRGDLTAADQEMRWFVRTYTQRSNEDKDIKDPDELLIVGQAGAENARWHSLNDQFRFILNEVYADALKYDPDLWQAEYLAGAMLLEKYNRPDAVAAFDAALKINPRAAEALVGKGQAALQGLEIKQAEGFAEEALKINPKLPLALRLRADVHLATGDIAAALKVLEEARSVDPREEATLARLAACRVVLKQESEFQSLVAEVQRSNPKPALFYTELASCLEDRRQYSDAEKYFKKAIELRDKLAEPRTGLGMLYLRLGKEAEAKELLTKAFEGDKFNVRVANSLKVLRHLDKYQTLQTDHFEVRFDPNTDKMLAGFVADYLEEVHAKLKREFNHEPKGRILFELFSSHEMFSGRTVALPDLHTIGACTGRVVAMASPRGKGVSKPFNWGRVIRHELVHIFNLDQTDFRVPHWLTEGLAVRNEGMNRPPTWSLLLKERFESDQLLDINSIQLGFVRPRSPDEWTLAYCQSQLYVDYVTKNYGPAAAGELLNAYREGLDDRAAIEKVCKVDLASFEGGYRAYLAEVVKAIPAQRKTEKPLTLAELEEAVQKSPDDLDLSARLADQYARRKKPADARKLVDAVLQKEKGHSLAAIVKARLLSAAGEDEGARALLEAAQKAKPDDARLLAHLGRLCMEAKEYTKAAELFEHGRKVAPLDADWLEMLDEIYTQVKDRDKRISVLREMAGNDPDNLKARLGLAELLLEAKQPAEAESAARDALQIDVLNEQGCKLLLQALADQKKDAEAEKVRKRFEPRRHKDTEKEEINPLRKPANQEGE